MKKYILGFFLFCSLFISGQAYALTSGTTVNGNLNPGDTVSYTISGTAGQGILLFGNSSYGVHIRIYRPDTSLWTWANSRFSGNLPVSGTYTVVVSSSIIGGNGPYSLSYLRGGDSVSNGSIEGGDIYSGTLAWNGIESFQFDGIAGQGIMFSLASNYDARIVIYRPDGTAWTNGPQGLRSTLPVTGTYTVAVYGSHAGVSGPYRLYYMNASGSPFNGQLSSGQSLWSNLSTNELNSYQFHGVSGDGIRLTIAAFTFPTITLFRPDGSFWTFNNSGVFSGNLTMTGTYTVVLSTGWVNVGSYRLDYVKGNDTVSNGFLISGNSRTGTMQNNGLESYKFSGVAGNPLSITSAAAYGRRLYVYRPNGSFWTSQSNSFSSSSLPATGDYTVVFQGDLVNQGGPYTITQTTTPGTTAPSNPEKVGADNMACSVGMDNEAGNPINFDVGFKKQTETDYNAGGLTFARTYRSDSTWTDNTIGALWRHNFARTLTVSGSAAEIIDGTGAKSSYTLVGTAWVADDPATTAIFETAGTDYLYTLPNNTVEKYDSNKRLVRIEYLGGGALNLTYDGSGALVSVENENGRQLTLGYSSGRVASLVTPDGTFSYSYDGNGNLITVTKPDTLTRQYHYENTSYVNALTGITDEENIRFATFSYDANGKAVLSEHAGSTDDYTVTYNPDGTTTVTNPLGKDTTYHFTNILGVRKVVQVEGEASPHCVASNRYYNYDERGRVISKTDWEGNTTRYEYDERSNITRIIEAPNIAVSRRITSITYDATYNLPVQIAKPGQTTAYAYDSFGRMTSVTVTDTATAESRVTSYDYYPNTTDGGGNLVLGRLKEIDGPRTDVSDVTEYAYDGNLNLTTITNALGQETKITARDAAGRPTEIEDANNVETALAYDSNGRLLSSTVAPATALEAETIYGYDANGNLTQITLPNGVTVDYSYDSAQRLIGVEDALGNTIAYTLDAAGNITKEEIKDHSATLKYLHSQVFDELSRIIESVGAASQSSVYAYDKNSNLTAFTDANANATGYAYDPLQRLVKTTDALSGIVENSYTPLDDLSAVKDQRNNSTTYSYNAFGDVTGEVSPDRGTIAYTVDKAGNITQRIDARGVVTDYTWDALNRLTAVAYPAASSLDAALTYDAPTGCGTAPIGQLCGVTDASGNTAYEYNDLGYLTKVTETRGALSFVTQYTRDLAGNVLTITLPSGRVVTYTRNANGQIGGVTADVAGSPVNLASGLTYLPFGPLNALTYGNALTFSATYDQDYNPTSRAVSTIYNHAYDTDDNGNIIQIGSTDYGYDALNRLDEEDAGSAVTYTYDATSNRLTKVNGGTTSTTVPATSNKISAVGADSYAYDSAGNITAIGTHDYTWNAAGQLAEVKVSSSTVGSYTYNASNQRTQKVAGGNTTHYVYGLNALLYGEYDNSGDLIREYVYLDSEPLAHIDDGSPEVLTYLHADHLGTPRFGTNNGGTQVWAWQSDAFGNGSPTGTANINLRMPGQYYDAESGLFYNWNRYYNPATGRYISSDPIGLEGGLNTFLYAEASPVMYADPEGLQSVPMSVPGLPIVLPPIVIPGTQENSSWVGFIGQCLSPKDDNNCNKLNQDVQNAKKKVGRLGKCTLGMTKYELSVRQSAWLDEAIARAKRDNKCFSGGDVGHQDAQARAWQNAGRCQSLYRGVFSTL